MKKINPFLWFDHQAEEAVNFYQSIFKNSMVLNVSRYGEEGAKVSGMDEGAVMTIMFTLEGQEFIALNGGPHFKFTPAISFFVNCDTREEVDELWQKLSEGGNVLMGLDQYPFSERFGWVADRYGISWQLNWGSRKQKITPFFMYVGDQKGKAEEAIHMYTSIFKHSGIEEIERYGEGDAEPEGTIKRAIFALNGQEFMAIDSSWDHLFTFTPAISFFVNCESQDEVDECWDKLSAGGEEGECGWLKDQYGVSWQIVPTELNRLLNDADPIKARNVMKAMLQMKKIDIDHLKKAYEQ